MTKKNYLCKIIGDGSENDPFRPAISDYQKIGMDRIGDINDGWCRCSVDAADHTLWADDDNIIIEAT